ncbi:WD repeat-containing protein 18-like [Formica exsecta]|uniref:WD repeat-containing protein 18-like n=1 Tax=Formica exsecta TaxID=72781 RepID=UPI001144E283|nr:WD repeat-containing protein 18-like [Formica exsecta]
MSRITEVILTSDTTGESWSAAIWDPRNGSMLSVFKNASALGHRTLQLLSDSYILGASATKSRLYIWPLNSPSPLSNIHLTTTGKMNALTCTPNGSYIIASVDEKIFIWQTCNGRMLANLVRHYQTINCLAITKDGSFFASAGEDGYVFVWSLYKVLNANKHDRLPVYTFSHHTMPIKDMLFGFGGARARLYTVSLDAKCNIYELGSGDLLLSLIFDVPLTAITVNSRESEFFVGCTTGDIFQCNLHEPPREIVLHVKNEETAVFRAHKSHVTALSVSVDCRTLLSGSTDGAVHIWDIVSRQVLRTIEHKGPVTAAFFTKGFENFRASTLEPRLEVHSLERVSETNDNESNDVIKVISRGRNPAEILDFQSYVGNTVDSSEQEKLIKQLTDLKEEINKLEKINTSLFKYSVTHILQETNDE